MADKNISPAKVYNDLYKNEKNPVYGNKIDILEVDIEHYDEKIEIISPEKVYNDYYKNPNNPVLGNKVDILEVDIQRSSEDKSLGEFYKEALSDDAFVCSTINSFIAVGEAALNFAESLSDVALISMRRNDMELPGKIQTIDEYKKDYQYAVQAVGTDITGEVMSKIPKTINDNAWGLFKDDSLVYGTIEKFTGVVLSVSTAGAMSIAPAVVYGANAMGTEFEKSVQKFANEDGTITIDDTNFNEVLKKLPADIGLGTLEGLVFHITYGDGYKNIFGKEATSKIKAKIQAAKSAIKDLLEYSTGDLKVEEGETVAWVIVKNAIINGATQLIWDKINAKMKKTQDNSQENNNADISTNSEPNNTNVPIEEYEEEYHKAMTTEDSTKLVDNLFKLVEDKVAFMKKVKSTVGKEPIKETLKQIFTPKEQTGK